MVELLLRNPRVNANVEDDNGRTPFFYATMGGRNAVLQLLLFHRVAVNTKDRYNSTPLFVTVRNGHEIVTEELLALEGLRDFEDGLGRTLFSSALQSGNIKVVGLVRQYAQIKRCLAETDKQSQWCDVCFRYIVDGSIFYKCKICNGSPFFHLSRVP